MPVVSRRNAKNAEKRPSSVDEMLKTPKNARRRSTKCRNSKNSISATAETEKQPQNGFNALRETQKQPQNSFNALREMQKQPQNSFPALRETQK